MSADQPFTDEMEVHPDQVAGHGTLIKTRGHDGSYRVLKPIANANAESAFYQALIDDPSFVPLLREWIPKCYGTAEYKGTRYLIMEDLCGGYVAPCVFDMKIGVNQHHSGMDEEKIRVAKEKCLNSTSAALGMRMCGMKIYKKNSDKHEFWGREYGQKYTSEQLRIEGLEYFFHDGEQFRLDVAEGVLDSLRRFKEAFSATYGIRLISSSILVTYDAKGSAWTVKMIDFAHTFRSTTQDISYEYVGTEGQDNEYLIGISSFVKFMEQIVNEKKKQN